MARKDMDEIPQWAAVAAQVVAGVAVVVIAVLKTIPPVRKALQASRMKRDRQTVLQNARVLRLLNILMREWLKSTGCQRILLLHARNNGRPWPIDKPVKVSCLDQVIVDHEHQTWSRWQDWHVDPPYRNFLHDLIASEANDTGVLLIREALSENCVLRDAYRAQGTVASVVFAIRWLPDNQLIYVSLNFGSVDLAQPRPKDPEQLAAFEAKEDHYVEEAKRFFRQKDRIRTKASNARQVWRQAT